MGTERERPERHDGADRTSSPDATRSSPPAPKVSPLTVSPLLGEVIGVRPAASARAREASERGRRPSVLLPICAYCKRVRAGDAEPKPGAPPSTWGSFESVVFSRGGDTGFTHSVCPECYEREIVPQLERLKHKRSGLAAG